jgi:hypothetical protein
MNKLKKDLYISIEKNFKFQQGEKLGSGKYLSHLQKMVNILKNKKVKNEYEDNTPVGKKKATNIKGS